LFGVPKIDVAQAIYKIILKFDETEPKYVKIVHIVNIDHDVTSLKDREFAWWFGGNTRYDCQLYIPSKI